MMRVVSSEVEEIGDGLLRVVTTLALDDGGASEDQEMRPLGDGPDRDTVPDRVVQFLIACGPDGAQMSEIQRAIGRNPRTANRQIWTLGTGGRDLPLRLHGWVESKGNGLYVLSEAAWERLRTPQWRVVVRGEMRRALQRTLDQIPEVVELAELWQAAIDGDGDPSAARAASDEGLYRLLGDAKRANTMFGEVQGWETTVDTNPFIFSMQRTGTAFRQAVHQTLPSKRLEALGDLTESTQGALDVLDQAFPDEGLSDSPG
jgi:hypothetical protein